MSDQALKRLHDGRMVSTNSEDWRHECEAGALLKMGHSDRARMLEGVEKKRGASERERLERTMYAVQLDREADRVLAMQTLEQRRRHLDFVGIERGPYARRELETEIARRWKQRAA